MGLLLPTYKLYVNLALVNTRTVLWAREVGDGFWSWWKTFLTTTIWERYGPSVPQQQWWLPLSLFFFFFPHLKIGAQPHLKIGAQPPKSSIQSSYWSYKVSKYISALNRTARAIYMFVTRLEWCFVSGLFCTSHCFALLFLNLFPGNITFISKDRSQ